MCKKPNPNQAWQWAQGYTEVKKNLPESVTFPVLVKDCACGSGKVAYRHGGTIVEVVE